MNIKTAAKSALTLSTVAAILSPTIVFADIYSDYIIDQLARAAILAGLNGYEMRDAKVNTMKSGSYQYIEYNLYSGHDYKFIAVCDQDCSDVDLRLYDENGNSIDSDIAADDIPIVSVQPRWNGRFRIRVSMARCRVTDCYYGLGVFRY